MTEVQNKATILAVDDSKANRMLMSKIFGEEYQVETAKDGIEAVKTLRSHPDTSLVILDIIMPRMDGYEIMEEMNKDPQLCNIPILVVTSSEETNSMLKALDMGAIDVIVKPLNPQIVLRRVRNIILRNSALKLQEQNKVYAQLLRQSEIDDLTGIYNKQAFCRMATQMLTNEPDEKYYIICWDIDRFKMFNDIYGVAEGDRLLQIIGRRHKELVQSKNYVYGRWAADHFVTCINTKYFDEKNAVEKVEALLGEELNRYELSVCIGVYRIEDNSMDIRIMCDRAHLALCSVKGSYKKKIAFYDESMRTQLLEEQEIISDMKGALRDGQFLVYLQPQYNYANHSLHGAEALVRWNHPKKGMMIPPGKFIPIFEHNGFITQMDEYVWEEVCKLQRRLIDAGINVIPISVNVSRIDIYNPHLCEVLLNLMSKYDLEPQNLRLEITESAYMDNPEQLLDAVIQLRNAGFSLEMDDFGSGYSSLNTLKEVPVDMLKLDMKFMEQHGEADNRSGSILSSIIRMAHWIKLPVLAEGVETLTQAEYLCSMGCYYMQGYYFARPMPMEDYVAMLSSAEIDNVSKDSFLADISGAQDFLNASTQSTLLFNDFVGGAMIIEYDGERVEAVRINDKFLEEIGSNREDYVKYQYNILGRFDEDNKQKFRETLNEVIRTKKEGKVELQSKPIKGSAREVITRNRIRLLAENEGRTIFYLAVDNISQEMDLLVRNSRLKERLTAVMESVPGGIMYFEITDKIKTVYFNDRVPEMFGYSRQEYEQYFANTPLATIYPQDLEKCRNLISDILAGKPLVHQVQFRHICKDGSWIWVQMTGSVFRKSSHHISASVIVMDIEKQVTNEALRAFQEKELAKQQKMQQMLYGAVPCAVMQLIRNGKAWDLVSFNETTWKIFGYHSKDDYLENMKDRKMLKNVHPVDYKNVSEALERAKKSPDCEPEEVHNRIICVDGTTRWVHAIFQKAENLDEKEMLLIVMDDITSYK